jgi:hypothetical protein
MRAILSPGKRSSSMEAPVSIDAKASLGSPMAFISSSADGQSMAIRVREARHDIAERLNKARPTERRSWRRLLTPESFFE